MQKWQKRKKKECIRIKYLHITDGENAFFEGGGVL
jgi:hypothetical protein